MNQSDTARRLSVLLHRVQDTQDVQEQVDDVQVEVDGGQDVFLRGELLHQQVCVIDDEATEDQSPGSSQDQLSAVTVEEELQGGQSQYEGGHLSNQLNFTSFIPLDRLLPTSVNTSNLTLKERNTTSQFAVWVGLISSVYIVPPAALSSVINQREKSHRHTLASVGQS